MNKSSGGKIKKRKTRKCLDEIRKKSLSLESTRSTNGKSEEPANKLFNPIPKVTNKRLTMKLGMFSKGVRSETITRPHLSENFKARMEENLHKIIDLANGKPTHTVTSGAYEKLLRANGIINESPVEKSEDSTENIVHLKIDEGSTSGTLGPLRISSPCLSPPSVATRDKCFTPPNQMILNLSPRRNEHAIEKVICIESTPHQSKDSSADEELYEYYKEWMDDIPAHLNENAPKLLDDDTIEKTKQYLQRIYMDNCRKDAENVFAESPAVEYDYNPSIIEQTIKQSILLNPIEYIKMYGNPDTSNIDGASNARCPRKRNSTFNVPARTPKYIMVNAERERSSYSFSISPENCQISSSVSEEASPRLALQDTTNTMSLLENSPVLTYYPRKLNP